MQTDAWLLRRAQGVAASGGSIDMEACFSQLTLDVIGKAVFNYDFDALTASSPLIQACLPAVDRCADCFHALFKRPYPCEQASRCT
jgi:hypothetical protein